MDFKFTGYNIVYPIYMYIFLMSMTIYKNSYLEAFNEVVNN
ncbi:hypothetical protein SAMN05421682_1141 [Chryseobacterium indoltheticum]|uniref:Uncharacterized protein n=1 Tax=Chryseobacterium indoltheticum TaxID=254 RepID=A0A381FCZ4_9FLAO|nr:hypothetical protein SAMN05421682_1141 [Chryseobacterium indoltheticum]SUX44425.1 Uncharacterised protein [Chryseobacterium indoltheticum]